jgi:hypothetical protein
VLSSFALSAYFYNILRGVFQRIVLIVLCVLNGTYYVLTNFPPGGHAVFDSMAFVLLSITVVILSFIYIFQLMADVKEEPLSLNLDFWFTASQLVYFVPSFTIFLTYGYLTQKAMSGEGYAGTSTPLTWLWGIHNVLLFLSSLLTGGGILWIFFQNRSR